MLLFFLLFLLFFIILSFLLILLFLMLSFFLLLVFKTNRLANLCGRTGRTRSGPARWAQAPHARARLASPGPLRGARPAGRAHAPAPRERAAACVASAPRSCPPGPPDSGTGQAPSSQALKLGRGLDIILREMDDVMINPRASVTEQNFIDMFRRAGPYVQRLGNVSSMTTGTRRPTPRPRLMDVATLPVGDAPTMLPVGLQIAGVLVDIAEASLPPSVLEWLLAASPETIATVPVGGTALADVECPPLFAAALSAEQVKCWQRGPAHFGAWPPGPRATSLRKVGSR